MLAYRSLLALGFLELRSTLYDLGAGAYIKVKLECLEN